MRDDAFYLSATEGQILGEQANIAAALRSLREEIDNLLALPEDDLIFGFIFGVVKGRQSDETPHDCGYDVTAESTAAGAPAIMLDLATKLRASIIQQTLAGVFGAEATKGQANNG